MKLSHSFLAVTAIAAVMVTCAVASPFARAATTSPLGGIPAQCIAACPDGYQYATCTADGHVINYFADPCLTHQETAASSSSAHSPSSALANDCGPNATLCAPDRTPVCIESKWRCVKPAASSVSPITLKSFNPEFPQLGKRVTIRGEGFANKGNIIHIGDKVVRDVYSANGKTMTFHLPRIIKPACLYEKPLCTTGIARLEPGKYPVFIETKGKMSNTLVLTIVK